MGIPNLPGALAEEEAAAAVRSFGLEPKRWLRKLPAKHIFTHREWHMTGYVLKVEGEGTEELLWADGEELARRAVPSAFSRYYEAARAELEG